MVRGKFSPLAKSVAGAVLLVAAGAAHAATPVYTGSGSSVALTGATGVAVGGATYDVAFGDGSCNGLFSGCSASSFAFTDFAAAYNAASALLDQVFINVANVADFGTTPNLTSGCTDAAVCSVFIPYSVQDGSANVTIAKNLSGNGVDYPSFFSIPAASDTNTQANVTFARFTPSAVPEPATWLLMMAGFAVASYALRRRGATSPLPPGYKVKIITYSAPVTKSRVPARHR